MLLPFDGRLMSITDYADTAIQFGFSVLFVTALPVATCLSLINNYVKVKFSVWKQIGVRLFFMNILLAIETISNEEKLFHDNIVYHFIYDFKNKYSVIYFIQLCY